MDYHAFPRQALFHRIGMRSATLEPDASGTFVGSSFMYATARDWARFGLLYLKDGIWEGERILPRGWVAYTRTPALTAASVPYGAHFWLDIPSYFKSTKRVGPPVPKDAFHAVGHEGQFITIIPSRELVLVRLGLARLRGAWDHASFISRILAAMGE
jgi:CubicO group peptidase (beta-lactamase class C family)